MRSKPQLVAASGNGLALDQAVFALSTGRSFATVCAPSVPELFHPNQPRTRGFEGGAATGAGRVRVGKGRSATGRCGSLGACMPRARAAARAVFGRVWAG